MRKKYKELLMKLLNDVDRELLEESIDEQYGRWVGRPFRTQVYLVLKKYLDKQKEKLGVK
ncbi:MAG: hypothetical protein ACTSVA_00895 [Candidatus Njordarchaeales archaeon]